VDVTRWRLDVPALVGVVVLGAAYLCGVLRLRRRRERWPLWPALAFLVLGLGSVVAVTMSPLGVYDRVLFWPRAVQNAVLLGLSPLLFAMGEPLELARRTLPHGARVRLDAAMNSRAARVIAFPLAGAVAGVVALLVLYLSPLYRLTLDSEVAHHLVWLALLLIGAAFFVPELDQGDDLLPAWCGYGVRVGFSFVDGLLDAVPGVVIMTMHGTIAASFYTGLHRTWGPSVHWDQTIGGGLMFTMTEAVALPLLVVLFVRWVREDERRGRVSDQRLDRVEEAAPGGEDVAASTRPWWETDPGPLAQRPDFRS
jgi:putative copper resistance protein D